MAQPRQRRRPTTTRRIHFYRIRLTNPDDDRIFEPAAVSQLLGRLDFRSGQRYMRGGEGLDISVWPEQPGGRVKLRIGGIRRTGLPMIEDAGVIRNLEIADRQGLVE